MPIYLYRCENKHTTELYRRMTEEKPKEVACFECDNSPWPYWAKRVYTVPHMAVDNVDKVDMEIVTGRNFSNKRELDSWLKANNKHIMDDSEWKPQLEQLKEQENLYKEVTAKGINWGEYNADIKYRKDRDRDRQLQSLGVGVNQISKEDFEAANAMGGWVDTVESDYIGRKLPSRPDGNEAWAMQMPTGRVPCPYEELTNGEVSNNDS